MRLSTRHRLTLAILACVLVPPAANAAKRADTGWLPSTDSVQWKVTQHDTHWGQGTEIRYGFRNNTAQPVRVVGHFTYTDRSGTALVERFNVVIPAHSTKGGQWRGMVFFTKNKDAWRLESFTRQ